jgi:predicted Zn-dependent protease
MPAYLKLIPATLIVVLAFALASPQQVAVKPWTPPISRQVAMPFAPKPFGGDNIFKGESEVWLADAVEKLDSDTCRPIDDKTITEYVAQVGNNLASYSAAPRKHYQFIVTTDSDADAMTAGGGRIYLTRGILEEVENEDQLAAVLAHEIAHDAFSHAAKMVTRQMFWLTGTRKVNTPQEVEAALVKLLNEYQKKPLAVITESLLGFARFDELEADRAAFYNIYKAGYNPQALTVVLKRLARIEEDDLGTDEYRKQQFVTLLFGSHPPAAQRTMTLAWESNFVKLPAKDAHVVSPAFDQMKLRLTARSEQSSAVPMLNDCFVWCE